MSIGFASDKLAGGIKAGATSVSLPVELRKSADSTELTGKVYTDVTASYWRQGGTRTAITTATLGSVGASYSSGGFIEVDSTNMPGVYRFDVPDAAFASGADWVVVSLKVATAFQQTFMFALETKGAAEIYSNEGAAGANLTVALQANQAVNTTKFGGTTVTGRDIGASVLLSPGTGAGQISLSSGAVTVGTNNDKTGFSLTSAYDPAKTAAQAGDVMKISSGTGANQLNLSSGNVVLQSSQSFNNSGQTSFLPVNVKQMNSANVIGIGISSDKWRGQ